MANIETILTHPTTGLIPTLEAKFVGNWKGFIISPYGNPFGYHIRSSSSAYGAGAVERTFSLEVGKLVGLNAISELPAIAQFCNTLDDEIRHWARCKCPGLSDRTAENIQGSNGLPRQNAGISSERPQAWWVPVVRSFDIIYPESFG